MVVLIIGSWSSWVVGWWLMVGWLDGGGWLLMLIARVAGVVES